MTLVNEISEDLSEGEVMATCNMQWKSKFLAIFARIVL